MTNISNRSTGQSHLRSKELWTALVFALVPVLIAMCSRYRDGAPYLELGGVSVRSLQFIEWSILASSLYAFIRLFRPGGRLTYLAWVAIYLAVIFGGLGYVMFSKWSGNQHDYLEMIKVVLMDFTAPITFGIAYRLFQWYRSRRTA